MAVGAVGQRAYRRAAAPRIAALPQTRLSRPVGGNKVSNTFTDREALTKLIADIDGARRKIQFETFLFNGEDGNKVADALIRARKRKVAVQVLLDGMGQRQDHYNLTHKLEAGGVDVRTYSRSLFNVFYAVDHSKLCVIDDSIAWTGGVNFDTEINRDMMTRVEGPAVPRFQRTFHQGWLRSGGTILPVKGDVAPKGDVTIQVSQTSFAEHTTRTQVVSELSHMKKGDRVDLWMMDFGDHQVLQSVLDAADRGVQIRALIDPEVPFKQGNFLDKITGALFGGLPDLWSIKQMLGKGIEVHSYQAPPSLNKLHAKVWLLTKNAGKATQTRRVIGGSVNALKSAYDYNHELGFAMWGKDVGNDVASQFEHDFSQDSTQVAKLSFFQNLKAEFIRLVTRSLV